MVEDEPGSGSDRPGGDRPGSDRATSGGARSRRPWIIGVASAIVVVVVVVLVVVSVSAGGRGSSGSVAEPILPVVTGSASSSGGDPVSPSDSSTGDAASTDPPAGDPAAVPTAPVEAPPVAIDAPVTAIPGLVFQISSMTSVEGTASAVGEVAGPSIQFTLTATNTTSAPISLETTVVNVTYGAARTPADALSTGGAPIAPLVEAGAGAAGTYIFNIPLDQRDDLRVLVDYEVGTPIAVFEGAGPS